MKVLSPPVSGSRAGWTARAFRGSIVIRTRAVPVQPLRSQTGFNSRSAFARLSSNWAQLSPAQQAAWTAAASEHPRPGPLGVLRSATGKGLYIALGSRALLHGQLVVATPPLSWSVFQCVLGFGTANHLTQLLVKPLTDIPSGSRVALFFAAPQTGNRSRPGPLRFLGHLVGFQAAGSLNNFHAQFLAAFGVRQAGQRVWLKGVPCNSGFVPGPPSFVSVQLT